jgi:hypothetical protein
MIFISRINDENKCKYIRYLYLELMMKINT